MANITKVQLTDTFNHQRETINEIIDAVNANLPLSSGNGINISSGAISTKITGDGLSYDGSGNIVGNDAYANLLTQVVINGESSPVPTVITDTYIDFPAFDVIFDKQVYYGKKISDFETLHVNATRMNVANGVDGAIFVSVNTSGQIQQSLDPVSPSDSSIKCQLGSYFRLNNKIQSGSWAYTPWNGATSKDNRFANSISVAGGLLTAGSTNTLKRNAVSVLLEGVNVSSSIYNPNSKEYEAENPYLTKAMWPTYSAATAETTTLDTTHIFNMTSNTVDDISSKSGFIVLVPGIVTATGQDVYLMAMSEKVGNNYPQIFPDMNSARDGIFGLQVSLGNIASRVSWLGQSIIVEIGCDDYSDAAKLQIVGQVPSVLGSYSNLPGAGTGTKIEGLTVKSNGIIVGEEGTKTNLNFDDTFTVLNSSESEVLISAINQFDGKISNCITEIPQDINLTLSNGTLTLKAGSKIYHPNGANNFNIYTISSDISATGYGTGTRQMMVFVRYNGTGLDTTTLSSVNSGSGSFSGNGIYYNTTTNNIDYYTSGSAAGRNYCFPIAIITMTDTTITSIDQVFNGFGYIGSTVFVLPGVKGLYPNGRNTDGTLKSGAINITEVKTFTVSQTTTTAIRITSSGLFGYRNYIISDTQPSNIYSMWYNPVKNVMYDTGSGTLSVLYASISATIIYDGTRITSFNPKTAFHAVDYNDFLNQINRIDNRYGNILQEKYITSWPSTTSIGAWPHTVRLTISSDYTLPTVTPIFSDSILTWEVTITNTNSNSVGLTWPSVFQPFNNETLPITIGPNTTMFFMMRKYSNNYVLVSTQGSQSNSLI